LYLRVCWPILRGICKKNDPDQNKVRRTYSTSLQNAMQGVWIKMYKPIDSFIYVGRYVYTFLDNTCMFKLA
jgi:hypothetical protein